MLAAALAGCSSMKAAILGSDEENAEAGASESDAKKRAPVGAYGVSNEPASKVKEKEDVAESAPSATKNADAKTATPPAAPADAQNSSAPVAAPAAPTPHGTSTPSTTATSASAPRTATSPVAKEPETPIEGIPVKPISKKDLEQDAKRDFERAAELLKNGQESPALVSFTDFLRRYPDHKLVGDAQFFIGEIFFRQRKYAEALHELQKVKDLLKGESQKTPDAFVKIGECHLKLGSIDRARIEWNAVKRRFAGTPAALQADVLLKGLPR